MPLRPPRACGQPGCKAYATDGSSYCAAHQAKQNEQAREADHSRWQNTTWRHLYNNAAWTKHLRPFILTRDPLCKLQLTALCKQHGGDPTSVVDHKIDHKGNPKLFYDPENCQGACKPCHDFKTGSTQGGNKVTEHEPHCMISLGVCTCSVGRSM